jgi:hypothetical protein
MWWMRREWVLKTLVDLGLSQVEAEVYFFLAQAGPVKGRDVTNTLKLYKHQLYRSLKEKMGQAKDLQASREELLSTWHKMIEKSSVNN